VSHRLPWLLLCSLLLTLATATACGSASTPQSSNTPQLYVNPSNPLLAVATSWNHDGRQADAKVLRSVAAIPSAIWAAGQTGDIRSIKTYSAAATRAHKVGLVVVYDLPYRDACGKYSSNTGSTNRQYRVWINELAAAIGSSQDIVIVEPDGLPDILLGCITKSQQTTRYQLLNYAMRTLGALPHAQVYLDAGNPGMLENPTTLAGPLVRAGIYYGKGFSANVSNFQQTDVSVAWSQWLEKVLGHDMKAVIDTSRNGHGPYVSTTSLSGPTWCNPPGRSLGIRPTLDTGKAGIAGFLWIKDPGVSDGACNGGPPAGQLWPQYAVGLAQGNSP